MTWALKPSSAVRDDFLLLDLPDSTLGDDAPLAAFDEAAGHALHLGSNAKPYRDRASIAWGDALPSVASLTLLAAIAG